MTGGAAWDGRGIDQVGPPRWPLTGRGEALAVLAEAWLGAKPSTVVLSGEPGVGRTRLAQEAMAAARLARHPTCWVVGTSAAGAVPLGAFAHLIPSREVPVGESAGSGLGLLQAAMTALIGQPASSPMSPTSPTGGTLAGAGAGGAPGRTLVLGVDDAHLLDELSLVVLHQLAVSGRAALVVTVPAGASAPEMLARLCRDGSGRWLELAPLARVELDTCLDAVLGAIVESRTREALWRVSRGVPLFAVELVEGGLASGALALRDGVWQWRGPFAAPRRLVETIRGYWGTVDPSERTVLELLALDEPLSVGELVSLAGADVAADLERRRLIRVDRDGARMLARLAHPLYGEVVRAQLPEVAGQRLRRRLLEVRRPIVEGDPLPGPDGSGVGRGAAEAMRTARLLIDSDRCRGDVEPLVDAELLVDAAMAANAGREHNLAERLANAAIDAGVGFRARLALLEALRWQGRWADAEDLAPLVGADARSRTDRVEYAVTHALVLFFGRGHARAADAALRAAETPPGTPSRLRPQTPPQASPQTRSTDTAPDVVNEDEVNVAGGDGVSWLPRAVRGVLAGFRGEAAQAARIGSEVLAMDGAGPRARAWAAVAGAVGHTLTGANEQAWAAVQAGWEALSALRAEGVVPELGTVELLVGHSAVLSRLQVGQLAEAEALAIEMHRDAMAAPASVADAAAALQRGRVAHAAGRLGDARRWLIEAVAGLRRCDFAGLLRLGTALLAQAHAAAGDPDTAARLIAEEEQGATEGSQRHPATTMFEPDMALAVAATAAAAGRPGDAAYHTRRAVALAAAAGQSAVAARARRHLVGLGDSDQTAGGPTAPAPHAHAPVTTGRPHPGAASGTAGGAPTSSPPRLGPGRSAATIASEAPATHEPLAGSASALAGRPGPLRVAAAELTRREYEVARLAAQGLSNHAIAARQGRSVRTIETHLARVYSKLGIHRRATLTHTLRTAAPPEPSDAQELVSE